MPRRSMTRRNGWSRSTKIMALGAGHIQPIVWQPRPAHALGPEAFYALATDVCGLFVLGCVLFAVDRA